MKKQTFLKGSLLLTVSALLAKILGAFFKLPLTAVLGGTGMGYFSCAYGLFLPLYAIFVTGLSTAVAKMVASYAGMNNMNSARYVRSIARKLFFSVGIIVINFCLYWCKGIHHSNDWKHGSLSGCVSHDTSNFILLSDSGRAWIL